MAHPIDYSTLTFPAANFAMFIVLAVYLYRKHATPALRARSHRISEHVRQANVTLSSAEMQLRNIKARERNLEPEKSVILEGYSQEATRMKQMIAENAKSQAARMEHDADRQAESEVRKAEEQLRAKVVALATAKARKKLSAELGDDRDRKLRERALADLVN